MPTELQDALDRNAEVFEPTWDESLLFADAARRVVNGTPTYLVYTRQDDVGYLGHIYQGLEASRMSANPNLPGEWFTALGVTEAPDGQ